MSRYDWHTYKHCLESRGYKVHEQRDKQGVLHGYTILRGNSRFKSSILGKGRNLTVTKLEATWKQLHPVAPSILCEQSDQGRAVKPSSSVDTSQTTERKPITEHYSERQNIAQSKPEVPSVFRKILSVDGKSYSIKMPMDAYKAMEDAITTSDESVPVRRTLKIANFLILKRLAIFGLKTLLQTLLQYLA